MESKDCFALYERILEVSANERYDIVVFNEIPWYLRGEILENNEVIYAEDEDDLDFWLYKQSKIWNGMKRRQRSVSAEDLIVGYVASTSQKHQVGVSAVNWANNVRGVVSGTAVLKIMKGGQ